jgi:hypothetical protein
MKDLIKRTLTFVKRTLPVDYPISSKGYPLNNERTESITPEGVSTVSRSKFVDCRKDFKAVLLPRKARLRGDTPYLFVTPESYPSGKVILTDSSGYCLKCFRWDGCKLHVPYMLNGNQNTNFIYKITKR